VNLALYHYAGNNPVKYTDPDGRARHIVVSLWAGYSNSEHAEGTGFKDAAYTKYKELLSSNWNNIDSNDTFELVTITSKKDFIDLINRGDIASLDVFGHSGNEGLQIGPGMNGIFWTKDISSLNKNSFNTGATVFFHGCKTACNIDLPSLFGTGLFKQKNFAESFANYFEGVSVSGFSGGAIKTSSPFGKIDPNFIHKAGNDVWYTTWGVTRTYLKQNGKMTIREY
jgi:hypothetical protein